MEEEKQERQEKERQPDFKNAYERAKFLSDNKELWPELVQKLVLVSMQEKDLGPAMGKIDVVTYLLGSNPESRHDVHWQVQTYLLREIWVLLKEIKESLKQPAVNKETATVPVERKRREVK